jgi:hypothetical protein
MNKSMRFNHVGRQLAAADRRRTRFDSANRHPSRSWDVVE